MATYIPKMGYGISANFIAGQTKSNAEVAKDMFLKLLVTQMKYRDPSQTTDPAAQINQMASLAGMEQMAGLNQNIIGLMTMTNTAQAVSLIGHDVEGKLSNGAPVSGKVTAVEFQEGVPMLKVGTQLISMSNVIRVTN